VETVSICQEFDERSGGCRYLGDGNDTSSVSRILNPDVAVPGNHSDNVIKVVTGSLNVANESPRRRVEDRNPLWIQLRYPEIPVNESDIGRVRILLQCNMPDNGAGRGLQLRDAARAIGHPEIRTVNYQRNRVKKIVA